MNTVISSLQNLFERDLTKLEEEIKLYSDENSLWKTAGEIKNSSGNLCLHLCGNLQHFIGKVLGKTDYIRNREYEFSARELPRQTLLSEIQTTKNAVHEALTVLQPDELEKTYPVEVFGYPMTTTFFLIHLATHLNYHLGQINYHRRIIA